MSLCPRKTRMRASLLDLHDLLETAYAMPIAARQIRWFARIISRPLGAHAERGGEICARCLTALVSLTPLILWGLSGQPPPSDSVVIALLWALEDAAMIEFSYKAFEKFRGATALEVVLTSDPQAHQKAVRWIRRASWQFQVVASLVGGGGVFAAGVLIYHPGIAYDDWALWLLTGSLGGQSAWLIIVGLGALAAIRTVRLADVRVVAPLDTPGLVEASDFAKFSAAAGLVLVVMYCAPLTVSYLAVQATSRAVAFGLVAALGLAAVGGYRYLAQRWIAQPGVRAKHDILAGISYELRFLEYGGRHLSEARTVRLSMMYRIVASSRDGYFSGAVVATYLAALIGVLAQVVIAALIHGHSVRPGQ